jgi:DNA polymerase III epsilon subunit-like protein
MKYLFFDTETTGKPKDYSASYEDIDNWPRVTQLAWMLCDEDGSVLEQWQNLIFPDGWEIPNEPFFTDNNMSTQRCINEGFPIDTELNAFMSAKMKADVLVAHNLNFDHRVLWAEFIRAGIEPRRGMIKFCTMMKTTKYCQLPGKRGLKWPTLMELHNCVFGKDFEGAHDAMDDVAACKNCFFELKAKGIIVIDLPVINPETNL